MPNILLLVTPLERWSTRWLLQKLISQTDPSACQTVAQTVRTLLLISFLIMFASCGPSREFRGRLDHFIDDASRLSALTSQGVNNEKFGDQLATVRADFDLLSKMWPSGYKPRAKHEFELAMQGWQLTYTVWNRSLRRPGDDELDAATNPQLMADLVIYAADKLPFLPPEQARGDVQTSLSYRGTTRMLMTEASNRFDAGVTAVKM